MRRYVTRASITYEPTTYERDDVRTCDCAPLEGPMRRAVRRTRGTDTVRRAGAPHALEPEQDLG
jgi:hypothetical protein